MKNKILTFIIGILIGAIVATLGWCIYIKSINIQKPQGGQMLDKEFNKNPSQMSQEMQDGKIPPQKPIN